MLDRQLKVIIQNASDTVIVNVDAGFDKRQFYSDIVTPLGEKIKADGTTVHIFYALQMGEKYRKRYLLHFAEPDIIEQDYGHEELLFFYPKEWVKEIRRCCDQKEARSHEL